MQTRDNSDIMEGGLAAFLRERNSGETSIISYIKNKIMNAITSNVTLMTLSIGAFMGVTPALASHDYYVAGGLAILGIVLVYLYHKFPTPTV